MPSKAATVEEYIDELPTDRKEVIEKLRKIIKKNLPKGFKECMAYGMIGYVVPLATYPKGYHVNPSLPLGFICLASQKTSVALHHLCIYGDAKLHEWFLEEYTKLNIGKLDMGKGCIRFKNLSRIPYELVGELCTKVTVDEWIKKYELMLKREKTHAKRVLIESTPAEGNIGVGTILNGRIKYYDTLTNKLSWEADYDRSVLLGQQTQYYNNGNIKVQGNFRDGKRVG
jgi:uncharacterized protein YdhG (YjbR/CyaY superfamily)